MSMITCHTMNLVYNDWNHLLSSFNRPWLAPQCLQEFADVVYQSGAPFQNCWWFIDGTVRPVCRPGHGQRHLYNSHKIIHAIKFQSVATPNGLVANLFGPLEGTRHMTVPCWQDLSCYLCCSNIL